MKIAIIICLIISSFVSTTITQAQSGVTYTCPTLDGTHPYGERIPDQNGMGSWFVWLQQNDPITVQNLPWANSEVKNMGGQITLSCTSNRLPPNGILVSVSLNPSFNTSCSQNNNFSFTCTSQRATSSTPTYQ